MRVHALALALAAISLLLGHRSLIAFVAYTLIILVHELGHAVLVRRLRLRVRAIQVHAFGGECVHDAPHSPRHEVLIAWGGVAAQGALFVAACALHHHLAWLQIHVLDEFLAVCVWPNAAMAAFNLLPIPPLDGSRAWRLRHVLRAPSPATPARAATPRLVTQTERQQIDAVVDEALARARSWRLQDKTPR